MLADDRRDRRRQGEPRIHRVLDAPDHAHRVLDKRELCRREGSQPPLADVSDPTHVVDDDLILRAVEQGVEGEIPAPDVLFHGAEDVVPSLSPRRAERGHLEDLPVGTPRDVDVNDAESPPDHPGVTEQLADSPGDRIRGDVEVLGLLPGKQVPDGTADDVGLVPRPLETGDDPPGIAVDQAEVNSVLGGGVDVGFLDRFSIRRGSISSQQGALSDPREVVGCS